MTGFGFRRPTAKHHVAPVMNRGDFNSVPAQKLVEIATARSPERVVSVVTAVGADQVEPDLLFEVSQVAVARIETLRFFWRAFRRVFRRISEEFFDFGGHRRQRRSAVLGRELHSAVLRRIVRRRKVDPADCAVRTDGVRYGWRRRRTVANERLKPMCCNDLRAFSGKLFAEKARIMGDNHRAISLVGKLSADGFSYPADRRESKFVGDDGSPA